MMTGPEALGLASLISLLMLAVALLMAVWRIVRGPSLPDRVLALDMVTMVALAFVCVIAIRTGLMLYIDIAIALALLGFLATVALARYIMKRAGADSPKTGRKGAR